MILCISTLKVFDPFVGVDYHILDRAIKISECFLRLLGWTKSPMMVKDVLVYRVALVLGLV